MKVQKMISFIAALTVAGGAVLLQAAAAHAQYTGADGSTWNNSGSAYLSISNQNMMQRQMMMANSMGRHHSKRSTKRHSTRKTHSSRSKSHTSHR